MPNSKQITKENIEKTDLKQVAIEIVERLEIIRKHRQEEKGLLTKLMEDELLTTISTLTRLLAEDYL